MESISGNSQVIINFDLGDLAVPLVTAVSSTLNKTYRSSYSYGKGQKKVNEAYLTEGTLNAGTLTLNLFGDLQNIFSQNARFTTVKEIFIANLQAETGRVLTVGNASSAGFTLGLGANTHTMKIGPEGFRHISEPVDGIVAGSSYANLKLDSGAVSIAYQIVIIGENTSL